MLIKRTKKQRVRKSRRPNPNKMSLPRAALDYRNLVLDPCNGPLTGPVGSAIGTGLFARYRRFIVPEVNADTQSMQAVCSLDSANHNIEVATSFGYSNTFATSNISTSVGVLAPEVSAAYRIIAACIKWVPTGPTLYRQGVVRSIVANDGLGLSGASMNWIAPLASHTAFNGAEDHEVVLFPNSTDLNFASPGDLSETPQGTTIALAVDGVDSVYGGLSTGTSNTRGYFDVTWVAEWMPARNTNMTVSPKPPVPITMAQLYDTIKPFATAAVNTGVRMALARMGGYLASTTTARIAG